jgi:hypothetical protein
MFVRMTKQHLARFQVLMATSTTVTVFWEVARYSLLEIYLRFRNVIASNIALMLEAVKHL